LRCNQPRALRPQKFHWLGEAGPVLLDLDIYFGEKLWNFYRLNLAPLRSAIGMMEQWNDGIMGSGILEWWI
jgi:hypothetical protein